MRKRDCLLLALSAGLVLSCIGEDALVCPPGDVDFTSIEADASQPQCGFDIVDPPEAMPQNVCTAGAIVFGPTLYTRVPGAPVTTAATFTVSQDGSLCVLAENGDPDRSTHVASATIAIDQHSALAPYDFRKTRSYVEKTMPISAGEHELTVRVVSAPGSFTNVTLRSSPTTFPYHHPVASCRRRLILHSLNVSPNPFYPPLSNATLYAVAHVTSLPGFPSALTSYRIEYAYQIIDSDRCALVRTLGGEIPVERTGSFEITQAWDGLDSGGALVEDGTYYYILKARLVRVQAFTGHRRVLDAVSSQVQSLQKDTPVEITETWMSPSPLSGTFAHVRPVLGETNTVIVDAGLVMYRVAADGSTSVLYDHGGVSHLTLHPEGALFGDDSAGDDLKVFDSTGAAVSTISRGSYRIFRFVPNSTKILAYHAAQETLEYLRLDHIAVLSLSGSVLAQLPVSNLRISRTPADGSAVFVTMPGELVKYGIDGAEQWRAPESLHKYSVSADGDTVVAMSSERRAILHLWGPNVVSEVALPDVVWDVAVSPSGQYSLATTKQAVYLFENAELLMTVPLPLRWIATADVSDDGYFLVGGGDDDYGAQVMLLSMQGHVVWSMQGDADNNGWRPYVRFAFGQESFYVKTRYGLSLFHKEVLQ